MVNEKILRAPIIRNVKKTEMKITIEILGLKGLILQRSGRDASSVRIYIFFFSFYFSDENF